MQKDGRDSGKACYFPKRKWQTQLHTHFDLCPLILCLPRGGRAILWPWGENTCMMVTQEVRKNSLCTSRLRFMRKNKTLICLHHYLVGFSFTELKAILTNTNTTFRIASNNSKFENCWVITFTSFCTSPFTRVLSVLKPLLGSRTTAFTWE